MDVSGSICSLRGEICPLCILQKLVGDRKKRLATNVSKQEVFSANASFPSLLSIQTVQESLRHYCALSDFYMKGIQNNIFLPGLFFLYILALKMKFKIPLHLSVCFNLSSFLIHV